MHTGNRLTSLSTDQHNFHPTCQRDCVELSTVKSFSIQGRRCLKNWQALSPRLRVTTIASITFVCIALATAADATYLSLKALLAQQLIAHAWQQTLLHDGEPHPPWRWADTAPVARLKVDAIGLDTWVLDGSDGTTLAFGPGMASGSAAPGERGAMVIGAHRDTHFKPLKHIKVGDKVRLQDTRGDWHEYKITLTTIADIRTDTITLRDGDSRLLLVTCYPFDALIPGGPLRFVVDAEAV